jgi:hypothetical protein
VLRERLDLDDADLDRLEAAGVIINRDQSEVTS